MADLTSKPMPSADALRVAVALLAKHGDDAEVMAALHADARAEADDHVALAGAMEVLSALNELRRTSRAPSERLH